MHDDARANEFLASLGAFDPETDSNDFSNAERLCKAVCDDSRVRYVAGRGWHRWNGYRYAWADDWMVNHAAAKVRELFLLASQVPDEKIRSAVIRHANASLRKERIAAMIALAAAIGGVKIEARYCDSSPHLLGVENGIVDLRSGDFSFDWKCVKNGEPFTNDFITLQAGTSFDPQATCPQWRDFVDDVFRGDEDLVEYVQRAVGYTLSADTSEHVLFFLYGSGANGKSVFVNVLKRLFGDYSAVISSETILARKHSQQSNDLARLPGKRLVIASELEDGARWNESLVKSLTGGDPISARFLYAEFFEFFPVFKLFVVGNHKPVVRGADEGIWRRLQLIPFQVFFPPERRDRELTEKLAAELPGILNWAIEGYRQWREQGLTPPSSVLAATSAYRAEEDRVGQFIEDRCELRAELSVQASVLYRAYHSWTAARGETPLSATRFGARLSERGIRKVKSSSMYYLGLSLLDKSSPQNPPEPSRHEA